MNRRNAQPRAQRSHASRRSSCSSSVLPFKSAYFSMGFSARNAGEHAAMKLCVNKLVHCEPLPRAAADDDGQVRLRRMSLGRGEGRLDADVGFLTGLRERRQARQQQFVREERRHVQTDDGSAVAHLQLLGHLFELREYLADVLEVVPARVGQRERAHAALEQRHAELVLERLDLMAHRGRSDE